MRQASSLIFTLLVGFVGAVHADLEAVGQSESGLKVRAVLAGKNYLGMIASEHLGKSQVFVYRIDNVDHRVLLLYGSHSSGHDFFECPVLHNQANCLVLREQLLKRWSLGQLGDDPETLGVIQGIESIPVQTLVMSEQPGHRVLYLYRSNSGTILKGFQRRLDRPLLHTNGSR